VDRSRATVPQIGEWMSGLWVVHPLRGAPHPNPLPGGGREPGTEENRNV
jgi:hypothetical protein